MDIRRLVQRLAARSGRHGPAMTAAVLFGAAGVLLLDQSNAATFAAMGEAEAGTPAGLAVPDDTAGASGGASVRFGAAAACGGPVTISGGGTYSGCYQSTNPATPAVRIATTAPVVLDHATVRHAGDGIVEAVTGVNVTVRDSKLIALDPGGTYSQRAIIIERPGSVIVEHNLLQDGQGMWFGDAAPSAMTIRYNEVKNISRYPHPTTGNCCVQFVQFDHVTGAAEIAWNRVTNIYGQSGVEDNINMYMSSGADAAHPIDIHHNMIDGAWPRSGDGSGYTGGGILLGDGAGGGHFGAIHDNRVINTANYGISITGGTDNHAYDNHVVSDMYANDGITLVQVSTANAGVVFDYNKTGAMSNTDLHDNTLALLRPDGRADWWTPGCQPSTACTGNIHGPTPTTTLEQAERSAWAADLAAAGLAVGPDW